jgi:hypothetical protein
MPPDALNTGDWIVQPKQYGKCANSAVPPTPRKPHWNVWSPEMMTSSSDEAGPYGIDPPEYGCDAVSVEAPTRREAIRKGTPLMKNWCQEARGNEQNPFSGVKAEPATCPHGVCFCENCPDAECVPCDEQWKLENPDAT